MMLYTKNAINVFNVALIAPVDGAGMSATGFGDNPPSLEVKSL
jgi:hypothetical protein